MGFLKNLYNRTVWSDNKTLVNAERMNNIERGITGLYNSALCASDFKGEKGVGIKTTDEGNMKVSLKTPVEVIKEELSEYNPDTVYFLVDDNWRIRKIIIHGVSNNYDME